MVGIGALLLAALDAVPLLGAGFADPAAGRPANDQDTVIRRLPDIEAIKQLKDVAPVVYHKVLDAFALSLHDVFLSALPVVLVALIVAMFIKEIPLRERQSAEPGEAADAEQELAAHL